MQTRGGPAVNPLRQQQGCRSTCVSQIRLQQRGKCVCAAALCVQHMLQGTKKCQKNGQDAMSTVFQLPRVRTAGVWSGLCEARDDATRRHSW